MLTPFNPSSPIDPALQDQNIANALVEQGFFICDDFVPAALTHGLKAVALEHWESGDYRQARVGQGELAQTQLAIRSDRIMWLDERPEDPALLAYLERLEQLRLAINSALWLGLFEWEGHLAMYPPGSFYRRHLDVFAHARQRQVSTILYLNHDWQPEDGGQLRIYTEGPSRDHYIDIAPTAGRLACFLSEQVYHEVLPSQQNRLSLTGWFRTRA